MEPVRSVYIVEPADQGWIIERLMRDIAAELNGRGVGTRIGDGTTYAGEDVVFNSRYLLPVRRENARINSLFITHVDDRLREMELRAIIGGYNSLVCLSPQDADFVARLRGSSEGVVGLSLPTRDLKVRPIRVAVFSAYYPDGRKNERWLLSYFKERSAECRRGFTLCFMGEGWETFCGELAELDMNYEILRYSRLTSGEYDLYKEALATVDALVYPGFDGGAMSVYDGIAAGIEVIASNMSYHRGLGQATRLFEDRQGFERELDRLHASYRARVDALESRSLVSYVDGLVAHWQGVVGGTEPARQSSAPESSSTVESDTLELYRSRYKKVGPSRFRSFLIRVIERFVISGRP